MELTSLQVRFWAEKKEKYIELIWSEDLETPAMIGCIHKEKKTKYTLISSLIFLEKIICLTSKLQEWISDFGDSHCKFVSN
jgi:hypothetical protein